MNIDLWEALMWGFIGGAAWTVPVMTRDALRHRRWKRERQRQTQLFLTHENGANPFPDRYVGPKGGR